MEPELENQNHLPDYQPEAEIPDKKNVTKSRFDYSTQDFQMLRTAIHESSLIRLAFYFLDYILRAQTSLFEQIHTQQDLPRIIASMSILSACLSAIYGATMGMNHSFLLTVSSAIKLPILFLLTALICIPSLYTFNVLLGQRFRFLQTVALMAMTLGTTTILLASLAPLSFFFALTTKDYYYCEFGLPFTPLWGCSWAGDYVPLWGMLVALLKSFVVKRLVIFI